jgi:hypothetical protein
MTRCVTKNCNTSRKKIQGKALMSKKRKQNRNSTLHKKGYYYSFASYMYTNKCHGFLLSLELAGKLILGPLVPILGSLTVALQRHLELTFSSSKATKAI